MMDFVSMLKGVLILLAMVMSSFFDFAIGKELWISIDNHDVYLSWPSDGNDGQLEAFPVLMAIHGNGRSAKNYAPGNEKSVPFYVHQRDLAVQLGFLFVVVSNGADTWGTDEGLSTLIKVHDYVRENYQVKEQWVLWGTSAGGLQMFRMIKEFPNKVEKVIGTFPVYDLLEAYERRKGGDFLWKDPLEFKNINPANFPSSLVEIPMLIFHGRQDEAVPVAAHSLRLRDEVRSCGGMVALRLVKGGHSTSNWHVYRDRKIRRFIAMDNFKK